MVGAYSGSVYLSTIWARGLPTAYGVRKKTLFLSGIVVMLGHIVLAAAPGLYGLLIGLIFIALGSGGVKSTASSMVGALYEQDEMRPLRDAGFSIFYIAINIGGFLGPLLTGLLQENIGFHYGFGAAAVGMAFGLWRYSLGRKNLPHPTSPIRFQKDRAKLRPPSHHPHRRTCNRHQNRACQPRQFLRHPLIYRHPCRHRLFRPPADQPPRQFRQQTAHHRLHPAFPDHLYVLGRLVSDLHRGNRLFRRNRQPHHRSFTVPSPGKILCKACGSSCFPDSWRQCGQKMGRKQPKTPLNSLWRVFVTGASFL
ncbi:oligopeptide:H+ symporter, partial [Neisseria gonorrhoeae]|uniref:oligopeptide:H+ symporter n=1 Tax=Neisseria gonorrhoeae TaxID=485 RepID=UPI002FCD2A40